MTYPTRLRWPLLGIPLLVAALILSAPTALAQVMPPEHHIEMQRHHLEQRADRFDQRLTMWEEHMRALPADQRATLEPRFQELRRERDQLRRDIAALDGVSPSQWEMRYDPVLDRMALLEMQIWQFAHEHGLLQQPPRAERQALRASIEQRLQRLDQQLTAFDERIAAAPVEQRAELQRRLVEMRQERERLAADAARLEAVPAQRWAVEFHPFHDRLATLEMRAHHLGHARAWVDVPTAAMMQRQRADLEQRLGRLDPEIARVEARLEAAPADQRPLLRVHLDELRRERDMLRRDVAALEGVPAEQWAVQFHPLEVRLGMIETRARHWEPMAAVRVETPAAVEVRTPTAAEMQQQRAELEQRLARVERDFATVETRVAAIPDEPMRVDLEAQLAELRQQRQQLEAQVAALEGVPGAEWHVRFRPAGEAVARYEAGFHRVRLTAAPTRVQHVQLAAQSLEMQSDYLQELHRQLDMVPAEQRAQMAYEIIQLRSRYDDLWRDHQRMRFAPVAVYERIRPDFPALVAQLETDIHMARLDAVAVAGVGS